MPIDDPIAQAKQLIASDEGQHSPVRQLAVKLLKLFNCTPVLKDKMNGVTKPLEFLADILQQYRAENVAYLLEVVTEEVQLLNREVSSLSNAHKRFIEEDWIKLVFDGMAKAQQTRAKERIRRMGRALAHAYSEGETLSPDTTEEMLRLAIELGERDVLVLREAVEAAGRMSPLSSTETRFISANKAWLSIQWSELGLDLDEVESIGSKLQSFGLLGPSTNFSKDQNSFIVLRKAVEFLDYIHSTATGQPED